MSYTDVNRIFKDDVDSQEVTVRGWIHNRRSSGGILFLLLRDGTGYVQCTLRRDALGEETFTRIERLPAESTIGVSGVVRKDARATRGTELAVKSVEVLFEAEHGFPISKKYHGPEFLLDHRHLWIRSQKLWNVMKVRANAIAHARDWLKRNGYTEVHVPTLVTAAVEGGSTLFEVQYFDTKAYLSQSWQLYAESVIASLGKIYTLAPSFRAERSRTRRHLTEFWHLEVEEPWLELEGLIRLEEEFITYIARSVATDMDYELRMLKRNPEDLLKIKPPFLRLTYDEAIQKLQEENVNLTWGDDIGWDQEKVLAKLFDHPFFITHFPKGVKAFYHMPDPKRPDVTLSVDVLAPEGYGEVTGGGQRIFLLDQLLERMREEGLNPDSYSWYVDLRRYGTVPHSGFGLGVERLVAWLCKLKHVRDATAFPRLINRVYP